MKKRLAQQVTGAPAGSAPPASKKSKHGAAQQEVPSEHGLEFVKERKLEALQSTFKQKNVEIRALKHEVAKEKFESHNAQAALSAFSRQWDLLNQELSTMADRLGTEAAQLSSGAQPTPPSTSTSVICIFWVPSLRLPSEDDCPRNQLRRLLLMITLNNSY